MGYYDYGYYGHMPFGGGVFGSLFMVFWWIFLAFGVVFLIKLFSGGSKGMWHHHEKSPLDILKERYAKGEIDRKEFEEKKKDLSS